MNNQNQIVNELLTIRASAEMLAQRAIKLGELMAGVSTPAPKRRKGLTDEQKAIVLANKRKHQIPKS